MIAYGAEIDNKRDPSAEPVFGLVESLAIGLANLRLRYTWHVANQRKVCLSAQSLTLEAWKAESMSDGDVDPPPTPSPEPRAKNR